MIPTDPQTHETVELLRALIRNRCVNDGTPESGHEIRNADTLTAYFGSAVPTRTYDAALGRRSVVARIAGENPNAPSLCLLSHLDVVPAPENDWRRDPFAGELVDGEVWGRGAQDMLNYTASMAVAVRQLATSGSTPPGDVVFAAVADEEARAAFGARHLLSAHADDVRTDYVFTEGGGYPINGPNGRAWTLAVAEKGITWIRLTVRGVAGHASNPYGADNATATLGEILTRLAAHEAQPVITTFWRDWVNALDFPTDVRRELLTESAALSTAERLGHGGIAFPATRMTITPTVVSGGTVTNAVPDQVALDLDIRTLPGQGRDDVLAELDAILRDLWSKVEVDWRYEVPGSASPATNAALATATEIATAVTAESAPGMNVVPSLLTASTDATYFRAAGARVYGFTPTSRRYNPREMTSMFHGPNERVDLESLAAATQFWYQLSRRIGAGK